jgi:putative tryptophan/tyrosine transport system substrate-binding protein
MRRRQFIAGLGAAAWPLAARAQQGDGIRRIGVLAPFALSDYWRPRLAGLHRGLADIGYIEGHNLTVEYRWAEDHYERLPDLAADLVRRQVAVIVTLLVTSAASAAKAATSTIPIVFIIGADPVEYGLVASLARPGGNLTGITTLSGEVTAKKMELLRELVPRAASVAYLFNPANFTYSSELDEVEKAARLLGLRLMMMDARSQSEIGPAVERMGQAVVDALIVSADALFSSNSDQIAALAKRHGIPSMFSSREAVELGGLMSYGVNQPDLHRQVGIYAGRILNGEKPADLPVQQTTRLEMVLNLKVAKALGITFPTSLLVCADEVIE